MSIMMTDVNKNNFRKQQLCNEIFLNIHVFHIKILFENIIVIKNEGGFFSTKFKNKSYSIKIRKSWKGKGESSTQNVEVKNRREHKYSTINSFES